MSAQAKPSEPSMEEILASIRRIISDDEAKPAEAGAPAPEAEPAPPPEPMAAIDDDVLDLGAEAALIATPAPAPAAEPVPPQIEIADDSDVAFADEEPVAVPPRDVQPESTPAAPAPAPQPLAPAVDMASLLSDQASSAVTNAFGQLASTVLSNNARTLEDLVKEMLKPMLKTWLDDNLPTMVEKLVRTEIERVARGGRN